MERKGGMEKDRDREVGRGIETEGTRRLGT
jgi:hypothetical protein